MYTHGKHSLVQTVRLSLAHNLSTTCLTLPSYLPRISRPYLDCLYSIKVHVPPLNHIGLWVDDLPEAVKWMERNGVRFTPGGIRKGAAGHDVTFIHPKGNEQSPIGGGGVLIELVQAPEEVIEALS